MTRSAAAHEFPRQLQVTSGTPQSAHAGSDPTAAAAPSANGCFLFGGTSASSPPIAATYALGGTPSAGYDGPSGLGVPNGTAAFTG
jgi:hypothetical protein